MSIIINGGYFLVNREGFVGRLKMPHTPSNKTYKNDSIYKNLFPGWLTKINNNYVPHL